MFETQAATCELVLFLDGEGVDKSMMFGDFEATLDNVVGIPAYANENKRAAYLRLNASLKITACVLFTVRFEEDGFPERSWNIPLRHMAEVAARGPDLGAGAIQLACRSQCPVSWHSQALWDPALESGFNTLQLLASEAEQAAVRFGFRVKRPAPAGPAAVVDDDDDIPVVDDSDFPVLMDEAPPEQVPAPKAPATKKKAATPVATVEEAAPATWKVERENLLKRVREQDLHIATVETDKNETLSRLGFMHQQQVEILEAQNSRLMSQFKATKVLIDAQREQIDAQRQQLESLTRLEASRAEEQRLHEMQLSAALQSRAGEESRKLDLMLAQKEQELASREQRLREEHRMDLQQRLEEETSRHQLQLGSLLTELREREDMLNTIQAELVKLRESQATAQQQMLDTLLRELAALGMNFVVFHPGVGNISVPVKELARYMQNPIAYAAAQCLVSEEQYRLWLDHHNNPRCLAHIGDNKVCDARLIRVDSPQKFVAGQSDRCARHQSNDSAIDNVLRFR